MRVDGENRHVEPFKLDTLSTTHYCGNATWSDYWDVRTKTGIAHTAPTLTLLFTSTLDQSPDDESFGFKNVLITVWPVCATGCSKCYGNLISECTECSSGYYLKGNTCVTDCGIGYWNNPSGRVCSGNYFSFIHFIYNDISVLACDSTCYDCNEKYSYSCTSCNGAFLWLPPVGYCISVCPAGYYNYGPWWQCRLCWQGPETSGSITYYSCKTCTAGAKTDCTSCDSPAFLYPYDGGDCRNPCPDGFWGNTAPRQCLPCYSSGVSPYSCKTCSAGTSSSCVTCFPGTFLHSGQCISPCPDGFWGNTETNRCVACNSACATCTGPANTECLSCNSGYLYSGQCLATCPIGYYAHSSKTCQSCHVSSTSPFSCRSCDGGLPSNCISCTANTYLYPNTYGQCLDPCPDGFWGDTTTWKCQPCYNPGGSPVRKACATCFGGGATSCLSCPTGTYYFSVDKTCLSTCPPGYYHNGLSNPNNLCVQCYQNNPPSSPDGTCLTCNGPYSNNCLSCGNFQYLDSTTGKCVNTCPIGYYANPTTNTCQKCYEAPYSWTTNQSCYTCTGTTSRDCTACLSGTFLYQEDQTCLYTCPDGWWGYLPTRICKICYQYDAAYPTVFTCATCTAGTANDCLTCNSPYFWDSTTGTCVQTCPDGYWGDSSSKTCKLCFNTASPTDIMKNCKTCFGGNNNQCTSCESGTYLYSNSNSNTCLGGCPGGWYPDTLTLSCKLCFQSSSASSVPNTCATCTGPNNNQCVTCLSGFYWDPLTSTCINPCSDGYYADASSQQCKRCFQASSSTSSPRSCQTCSGALESNCLSCSSGEYLLPSTSSCLSTCPAGTYPRTDINWCGNCYQAASDDVIEKSCATCNGWKPTNCLTCPSETYYYPQNSTCLSSCPGGTYYDTNLLSCQPCYQTDSNYIGCLTCTGPMYTQCTSCADGLFYFEQNGTCGTTCPCGSGYFYSSTTKQCGTCYPGCEYCTSSNSQDDCYYTDKYDTDCLLGEFEGKTQTQSMSMFVQITGQSTYVLSMATVVLSGASTMGAPIVFTYMGLLGLYQYLNVDYGSNAVLFFQNFFSFNNEGNLYPNYFSSSDSKYWNSDTRIQGNNKFYLYRISYLFLKNFGSKLSLLLTLVATTPFLTITAMVLKNAGMKEKYLKMFNAVKSFIQWNLIITVFLSSFVPMVLSFCLELHFLSDPIALYDIFSTTVSLVATITVASLTFALCLYTRIKNPKSSHPNLCKNAKILANQEDFTKDHEPNSKNKYWALLSCLRSLFLVTFVSTLSNYPLIQCSTALGTNVAFFIGILKFRFFDRKIKDIIIKVCEGLNAVIPSLFLVHSIYEYMSVSLDSQKKLNIGWGIIALITTVTVLTLVYQIIETLFVLKMVGTPLYNKVKAFLAYSIGKDIWKRSHKKSLEMTNLKTSQEPSQTQRPNEKTRDNSYNHLLHDETHGTIIHEPSDLSSSISARTELPKNSIEKMNLKQRFPLQEFSNLRRKTLQSSFQ